jgi:hypothetical protein
MMRGVLRSLLVLSVLGGIASAGDPMPAEQPTKAADPKFEVVKKDPPAEGAAVKAKSKHKTKHKARKHKKSHRKAAAKKAAAK